MSADKQTGVGETTVGHAFRESEGVRSGIGSIVRELESRRGELTGVRGARSPELKQEFDEFLARGGVLRGRGFLYPLVGSGLGNGTLVELLDGSVKYDMITGIGVHFFGHSDPGLVEAALVGATGDIAMQGNLVMNREAMDFADVLVSEAGRSSRLAHAFLCNSGAMANEHALKVCYQKNDGLAPRVIAFSHCFMGRSTTMAQIGDSAGGRQGVPLNTLVDYMPFYDHVAARRMSAGDVSGSTRYIDMVAWHLEEAITRYPKQHACFIFELVQGEGGFNTALPEFHKALMEICKAHGVAVWADEVQTFGRTEQMFCFEALGLGEYIDVCTVGKMSQVCATLYTPEYNPKAGLLSGTFIGSTMSLHVGTKILERLRDGGYYGRDGSIARHHNVFKQHCQALMAKHPEWFPDNPLVLEKVGGFGGMVRFTPFGGKKEPILRLCRQLFDDGVICFYCGHDPFHVRMLPPLGVMREEEWAGVFEVVEQSMATVHAEFGEQAAEPLRPMHASGG